MRILETLPASAIVELTAREVQLIRGSLLEADEAIRDDVAFSARVGATRAESVALFDAIVVLQRNFPSEAP